MSKKTAEKREESVGNILEDAAKILGVEIEEIPARAEELFSKWKKAKKAAKKGEKLSSSDLKLTSKKKHSKDILKTAAGILRTQPEHIIGTINRFLEDIKNL